MFEKVSPYHSDKRCDILAGAIVDIAYSLEDNPKIAVEVLIGHGNCHIIAESSVRISTAEIGKAVKRIAGDVKTDYLEVPQDIHLAENQAQGFRCGDNGIFKGVPLMEEQKKLTRIAREIYEKYPSDGKYILDGDRLIICQNNVSKSELEKLYPNAEINPLGDWTGGSAVASANAVSAEQRKMELALPREKENAFFPVAKCLLYANESLTPRQDSTTESVRKDGLHLQFVSWWKHILIW